MEQINEAVVQRTGGARLKKGNHHFLLIFLILAALIAAAYAALCAYAVSLDTFSPNRHINGIDVSGLSVSEAQAKLEREILNQEITILDSATQEIVATVTVSDLGFSAEHFQDNARFWMENEQQEPFLRRGWNFLCYWSGRYPGGSNWPDPDKNHFNTTTKMLAEQLSQPEIDGAYTLEEGTLQLTKAKDGRSLNLVSLKTVLGNIAEYSSNGYCVEISFDRIPAKVLTPQEIYDEVAGEMQNAGYDKATASITPEKIGVEFDTAAAQAALDIAQPGETITVSAQVDYPTITAKALAELLFRDVLGEARTHVSGTAARINNVKLSAATIHEYVLNPGEVFSYNEAVGQRTAEAGYQPAPAYIKGETVDEIGGGICQTSSTLYLACLRGNLEITERYAHRYVPAYIAKGMDATVSWGGPDYKFTNDTDYPVKIITQYEKNYLTVQVVGTNLDGSYAKVTFEQLSSTPWETVYEEDPLIPSGTEQVKTTPYTGYRVKTYHTIYAADGKMIDSHYEATSDYKARNQVILRAPGELPADPNAPLPTPEETETPADPPNTAPDTSQNPTPETTPDAPASLPEELPVAPPEESSLPGAIDPSGAL